MRSIVVSLPRAGASALLGPLAAAVLAPAAAGQWSADPMQNSPVVTRSGDQTIPKVALASDGGCWVSWFDNSSGNYDVYIQRYSRSGHPQFMPGGLLVSNLVQPSSLVDYDLSIDAFGDAYVAFTDAAVGSDRDARVARVTVDGTVAWSVGVSGNSDFEADPRVREVATGVPSVVVTWSRGDSTRGIFMQRLISIGGVEVLTSGGIRIAGDGVEGPAFQEMIATDDGGFIMSYLRDTRVFSSPRHIWAQKYDANGNPQWNGGAPVVVSSFSVPIAHRPRLASDGAGGCVIAWHDSRGPSNCYVQRLDSSGAPLFTPNGVPVSTNAARIRFDPAIAINPGTGDISVFFSERSLGQGDRGLYAQRLNPSGARMLTDDGKELLPVDSVNEDFIRAAHFAGDSIVYFLQTPIFGSPNNEVLALRVNAAADPVWATSPRTLSSVVSSKGRLPFTVNAQGMGMVAWTDNRNVPDPSDVYVQNVYQNGRIGFIAADLNGDGIVSAADLALLLGSWGPCPSPPTPCPADLNGDGVVNALDIPLLLGSWG